MSNIKNNPDKAMETKTAEEIIIAKFGEKAKLSLTDIVGLMEEYASQFYPPTEVSAIIKKVLADAAERATTRCIGFDFELVIDKESITNINPDKYLKK